MVWVVGDIGLPSLYRTYVYEAHPVAVAVSCASVSPLHSNISSWVISTSQAQSAVSVTLVGPSLSHNPHSPSLTKIS